MEKQNPYNYPFQERKEELKPSDPEANRPESKWKKYGKFALLFVIVAIIIYLVLNGPALWSKVKYYYQTNIRGQNYEEYTPPATISGLPSPYGSGGTANNIPIVDDNGVDSSGENPDGISIGNNQIYIPKIDVRAPVIWDIDANQALKRLRDGIVHIKHTSFPGELKGNVFITGHSSYYFWDPGKYKHIFALLPQIQNGNKVYIKKSGVLYTYRVYQTLTVHPNDTYVMNPVEGKTITSLMTCVPIGTSLRRFIVRAEQIGPKPTKEQKKRAKEAPPVPTDLLPRIFN